MLRLILDRVLFSIVTVLAVALCLFVLTRSIAGTPARIVLGTDATEAQIAQFDHDHGLDQPVLVQYARWIGGIAGRLDFGNSLIDGQSISAGLRDSLPITLELVLWAFVFAVIVALPLGILAASFRGGPLDHLSRVIAVLGISIPGFWLGLMLIRFPAVEFGWFPPGGWVPWSDGVAEHLQSLALPAFALGIYYVAVLSRMTRAGLIEVAGLDYMRTARAMGISRMRCLMYALKNALVPVVSVGAMSFGYMFGWALIIEYLFNIPGMSNALLNAINNRDYAMVQAVVLIFTLFFIVANIVADIVNAWLNPRVGATA
jgi:peptide/nickel transport system permease protein